MPPRNRLRMTLFALMTFTFLGEATMVAAKPALGAKDGVAGIVFFNTKQLDKLIPFYIEQVGCQLWQDQGDCKILRFGNLLFGFCQRPKADLQGLITFFYDTQEAVDRQYAKFKTIATTKVKANPRYQIYHFFAKDPEGRAIEFQYFQSPINWQFDRYPDSPSKTK